MIIKRIAFALPIVLAGWVTTLAGVALLSDAAPGYVVLLPSADLLENLEADISILAAGPLSLTVTSSEEGLSSKLYAAGAKLVLPAGLPGCLPLPKS